MKNNRSLWRRGGQRGGAVYNRSGARIQYWVVCGDRRALRKHPKGVSSELGNRQLSASGFTTAQCQGGL